MAVRCDHDVCLKVEGAVLGADAGFYGDDHPRLKQAPLMLGDVRRLGDGQTHAVAAPAAAEAEGVVDLLAALEASVNAAKAARRSRQPSSGEPENRPPAEAEGSG